VGRRSARFAHGAYYVLAALFAITLATIAAKDATRSDWLGAAGYLLLIAFVVVPRLLIDRHLRRGVKHD